jgi:hypothetical protein
MIKTHQEIQNLNKNQLENNYNYNNSQITKILKNQNSNYETEENIISQIIDIPQNENEILPLLGEWVRVSSAHNIEYQKIFKSSQENFLKNTQVLFMRYELFHLCLAELVYESKGDTTVNSFILSQISKIHEQLFKIGLKNLANIFENENYFKNDYIKNNNLQKESINTLGNDYETSLKFRNDPLKIDNSKTKKKNILQFYMDILPSFPNFIMVSSIQMEKISQG